MNVRVKLFAAAKQLAGAETVIVEMNDTATVAALREAMAEQIPSLRDLLRHALFAVNTRYVSPNEQIPADAEVACIPPVSGG